MIYSLSTSGSFYSDGYSMKELEKLGFAFTPCESPKNTFYIINDSAQIEINSLEELIAFVNKYGRIVLTNDSIEIYNSYRE